MKRPKPNRKYAEKRLEGLLGQLKKNNIYNQYNEEIQKLLDEGYVEEVHEDLDDRYYFPHFAVYKPGSTTSIRIIMDGKAKSRYGESLNDYLDEGPHIYNDITDVLTRFMVKKYAFMTDIKKCFYQIEVPEEDRKYLCFIWNFPDQEKKRYFQFRRHPFGKTDSPPIAVYATREHIMRPEYDNFKEARYALLKQTVIDDVVASFDSKEQAESCLDQIEKALADCSMQNHKTATNFKNSDMKEYELSESLEMETSILGMLWNTEKDYLTFKFEEFQIEKGTKLELASHIARVYDPQGFLGGWLNWARMILQQTHDGTDWKDKVKDTVLTSWKKWLAGLPYLKDIKIRRHVVFNETSELHVFADSSRVGLGAVAYLVTDGESYILRSKSKVAPLRYVSIPRLELRAAEMAANLAKTLMAVLGITQERVYMYTDSLTTLSWIQLPSRDMGVFVGNRVENIIDIVDPIRWRHVPGLENPADLLTRELDAKDLVDNKFWGSGPEWLAKGNLPKPKLVGFTPYTSSELRAGKKIQDRIMGKHLDESNSQEVFVNLIQVGLSDWLPSVQTVKVWITELLERKEYSWTGLIAALVAYLTIRKFLLKNRPNKDQRMNFSISRQGLFDSAMFLLYRHMQHENFSDVINQIKKGKGCHGTKFGHLNPFLDPNGILRVGSRIGYWTKVPYNKRCPIILSAKRQTPDFKGKKTDCVLIQKLVKHVHLDLEHTRNTDQILAQLQSQHWIIGSRILVKRFVNDCLECIKNKPRAFKPQMGALPEYLQTDEEVEPVFKRVALDYAGPFETRTGQKLYVLVIACRTTQAVSFEVTDSLSSDQTAMAIDRHIAVFGLPSYVQSDNGGCFTGLKADLDQLRNNLKEKFDQYPEVIKKWRFSPGQSPWVNGAAEAQVKNLKANVFKILGKQRFFTREFETACKRAQALINSRPLMAVSSESGDFLPLTPNDFMSKSVHVPMFDGENISSKLLKRYLAIDRALRAAWKRYWEEIVPKYHTRSKWQDEEEENLPSKDDLVLMLDRKTPYGKFQVARVIGFREGSKEGQGKTAILTSEYTTYERSVRLLAPLMKHESSSEEFEEVKRAKGRPLFSEWQFPGEKERLKLAKEKKLEKKKNKDYAQQMALEEGNADLGGKFEISEEKQTQNVFEQVGKKKKVSFDYEQFLPKRKRKGSFRAKPLIRVNLSIFSKPKMVNNKNNKSAAAAAEAMDVEDVGAAGSGSQAQPQQVGAASADWADKPKTAIWRTFPLPEDKARKDFYTAVQKTLAKSDWVKTRMDKAPFVIHDSESTFFKDFEPFRKEAEHTRTVYWTLFVNYPEVSRDELFKTQLVKKQLDENLRGPVIFVMSLISGATLAVSWTEVGAKVRREIEKFSNSDVTVISENPEEIARCHLLFKLKRPFVSLAKTSRQLLSMKILNVDDLHILNDRIEWTFKIFGTYIGLYDDKNNSVAEHYMDKKAVMIGGNDHSFLEVNALNFKKKDEINYVYVTNFEKSIRTWHLTLAALLATDKTASQVFELPMPENLYLATKAMLHYDATDTEDHLKPMLDTYNELFDLKPNKFIAMDIYDPPKSFGVNYARHPSTLPRSWLPVNHLSEKAERVAKDTASSALGKIKQINSDPEKLAIARFKSPNDPVIEAIQRPPSLHGKDLTLRVGPLSKLRLPKNISWKEAEVAFYADPYISDELLAPFRPPFVPKCFRTRQGIYEENVPLYEVNVPYPSGSSTTKWIASPEDLIKASNVDDRLKHAVFEFNEDLSISNAHIEQIVTTVEARVAKTNRILAGFGIKINRNNPFFRLPPAYQFDVEWPESVCSACGLEDHADENCPDLEKQRAFHKTLNSKKFTDRILCTYILCGTPGDHKKRMCRKLHGRCAYCTGRGHDTEDHLHFTTGELHDIFCHNRKDGFWTSTYEKYQIWDWTPITFKDLQRLRLVHISEDKLPEEQRYIFVPENTPYDVNKVANPDMKADMSLLYKHGDRTEVLITKKQRQSVSDAGARHQLPGASLKRKSEDRRSSTSSKSSRSSSSDVFSTSPHPSHGAYPRAGGETPRYHKKPRDSRDSRGSVGSGQHRSERDDRRDSHRDQGRRGAAKGSSTPHQSGGKHVPRRRPM